MVALALEEQGIDVVSVGNGEAAVRRIPDLAPDLVLADVFMPVRNGYEVCEFVKKDERFSHVPVILLVGAFDPLDEKEARRVGADGVLKKPFVPPDPLIAMVTSALEKNPKVAAEMAREREAAQLPPEPPPIALAPPARTAPKPLPEFPEPSPEEAALIYGFEKKSQRSEKEEEEAGPRFAPPETESEEEFDDSATASDWRRNAANFEVPEELGSKPAFSTDEDFGPVVFPSERNASSRRAPPATHNFEPAIPSLPETPLEQNVAQAATESAAPSAPAQSAWDVHEEPVPSSTEYSDQGWMSAIFGKFHRTKSASEERNDKNEVADSTPEPVAAAPAPASVSEERSAKADRTEHEKQDSHQEVPEKRSVLDSWFAPHPSVLDVDSGTSSAAPSAFSAEPVDNLMSAPAEVDALQNASPEPTANGQSTKSPASGFPWSDVTSMSSEFENHAAEPHPTQDEAPATAYDDAPAVSERAAAPTSDSANGPALHASLPPSPAEESADNEPADDPAVHNAPIAPIFAPHGSFESMAETSADDAPFGNDPGERVPTAPPPNREALAGIPFLTPPAASSIETNASQPDATRWSAAESPIEAVPSQPVASEPQAPQAAEHPTVDAVVSRLLEKLKPQLHEMLSKDLLKPLVENLLHEELENKSK
jgi:CheY-like chemotaxis protein